MDTDSCDAGLSQHGFGALGWNREDIISHYKLPDATKTTGEYYLTRSETFEVNNNNVNTGCGSVEGRISEVRDAELNGDLLLVDEMDVTVASDRDRDCDSSLSDSSDSVSGVIDNPHPARSGTESVDNEADGITNDNRRGRDSVEIHVASTECPNRDGETVETFNGREIDGRRTSNDIRGVLFDRVLQFPVVTTTTEPLWDRLDSLMEGKIPVVTQRLLDYGISCDGHASDDIAWSVVEYCKSTRVTLNLV